MNDKRRIATLASAGVKLTLAVAKPVKQNGRDVMQSPELGVPAKKYRRGENISYPSKAV